MFTFVSQIYLHPLILAFENGEEDQWAGRALAKSPFWSWSDKPLWSKVPEVFKAVLKFAWECSSAEDMLFVVYVEANVTDLRHLETSWLLGSKMQSHSQCYVFKITYESDQGGNIVPDITMFIWDYQLTPQLVPNSDKLRYDARSVPIHMTKTIIAWFYWVSQIQCGYDLPTHQERLEFQQRINNNLVSALKQNKIQAVEPPRPWPLFIPMRKPDVIDPLSRRNIAFPAGFETPDNYFTIDSNMVVPANPRRVGYATTHPPTVAYVDPVANLPTYSRVRSSMRIRQPICPPIMQLVSSQLTDAGIKLDRLFASPERVGTIVSSLYKFGRWVSSRFLASSLQNQYLLHQLYDHGAIWDPVDGRPIGIFPERHRTNMLRLSALNLATPMRVRVVNALTKAWNVLPWSVIKLKEVEPWEAPRDEIFARPFTFHAFWRSPQSANTASECRTETFNFIMDLMEDQDRLMLLNLGGGEAISPQDWIPIVHKGVGFLFLLLIVSVELCCFLGLTYLPSRMF